VEKKHSQNRDRNIEMKENSFHYSVRREKLNLYGTRYFVFLLMTPNRENVIKEPRQYRLESYKLELCLLDKVYSIWLLQKGQNEIWATITINDGFW
jgi:hypothetical protein